MNNVILIGMPGAGKSTIGVLLAKHLSKEFVDTDLLIQNRHRRSLQEIVDRHGHLKLREIEEAEILALGATDTVIATGGSAVYSEKAMDHLRSGGITVYLKLGIDELKRRIGDFSKRGLAKAKDQSFKDLFVERGILYERYGDVTIACAKKPHEEIVREIGRKVGESLRRTHEQGNCRSRGR